MADHPDTEEPTDGRTARAVRTRRGIVDATLALVEEGDVRPTAPRVAERAGVSVRSVFQHFDDMESLYEDIGARTVERVTSLVSFVDPGAPLEERITSYVSQRCAVNEALTPINRAAVVHAHSSATIGRQFQDGHDFFAARLAEVFSAELAGLAPADSRRIHDALLVTCSWATWNLLRSLEGRSADEAARTVEGIVRLLLDRTGAAGAADGGTDGGAR